MAVSGGKPDTEEGDEPVVTKLRTAQDRFGSGSVTAKLHNHGVLAGQSVASPTEAWHFRELSSQPLCFCRF